MEKSKSNYWRELRPLWGQEIKLWFGWTDWLNAIITTGIQVIAIVLLYYLSRNADDFLGSAFLLVCQWIVGFALLYFVLTITYVRASKKLYEIQEKRGREKSETIKRLENRQRNPFQITERPPHPDNRPITDARSASITVKNILPIAITECFLTLDSIKDATGTEKLTRQRKLSWSSGETRDEADNSRVNKEIDIAPNVEAVADIAETAQTEIMTTVWRGGQPLGLGSYDVYITAHGKVNGNDVTKSGILVMEYKGNNEVKLRMKKVRRR